MDISNQLRDRWMARERPLPPDTGVVAERYRAILAVDGSTLDALIRKIGLLKDLPENPIAGRMTAYWNLCTRLPEKIWYERDPKAHDHVLDGYFVVFEGRELLIFDKGYINFSIFVKLTQAKVKFISAAKQT